MKNYLIISLLFLSVVVSQQKKTDKPNPMKGVKTQTKLEYEYEEKFGDFKNNILKKKTIHKYDSKNRTIESIEYKYKSRFGELQEIPTKKTTYEYEEY